MITVPMNLASPLKLFFCHVHITGLELETDRQIKTDENLAGTKRQPEYNRQFKSENLRITIIVKYKTKMLRFKDEQTNGYSAVHI